MFYIFLEENQIKLMTTKKSFGKQYEVSFFEKEYQQSFLNSEGISNIDLVASAIKDALISLDKKSDKKEIILILPQKCFFFLRTQVPRDIAHSALISFIKDKAQDYFQNDANDFLFNYFIQETATEKEVCFFSLEKVIVKQIQEVFNLLQLKIVNIVPETLTYFKLFEKTLRKNKKEIIYYVNLNQKSIFGYLYDSFGLISNDKWREKIKNNKDEKIELILKKKIEELKKAGFKLNRLIISGSLSETIRQDTFTKEVGVWTNPLKRIILNFYHSYLNSFVFSNSSSFPFLNFDVCLGAFIFSQENKNFIQIKKRKENNFSLPKINLPQKEVFIFIFSFFLSFLSFFLINKAFNSYQKKPNILSKKISFPSPTNRPSPTPTPSPSFKKEELKIKVLNGSGVPGKAAEVKEILKEKNYQEILTGNAQNFDYQKTEIQIKKSKINALSLIKNDLKENLSSTKETFLSEDEAADIIIIVGKDFK
ncbi:MAG: LytR C-terminal domain-containing protein [Patescibacteria group bacterium]|nr:LytR C-terminal domain-containing protein [Patescibacteria group bacterium]